MLRYRRAPPHLRRGRRGERRALLYLLWRGWQIIAVNVRAGPGEIDIIAQDGRILVFIEVKTRRLEVARIFHPLEAVDIRKIDSLERAGAAWMRAHALELKRRRVRGSRLDVITVTLGRWRTTVTHVRNI